MRYVNRRLEYKNKQIFKKYILKFCTKHLKFVRIYANIYSLTTPDCNAIKNPQNNLVT